MKGAIRWVCFGTLLTANASAAPGRRGAEVFRTDLIRTTDEGLKIFVEAGLPDGTTGFFTVDTGSEFTVISTEVAQRLGLQTRRSDFPVTGLSGTMHVQVARLKAIDIGGATVRDLEVGVGVPGLPSSIRFMPVAGIIGNDVWSKFAIEIDYPASTMTLYEPGTLRMPGSAEPMWFDGAYVTTPVQITTGANSSQSVLAVDTGHTDLMFVSDGGNVFKQGFTEGLEPLYGIGANFALPSWSFLEKTRRIPVDQIRIGGATISDAPDARWVDPSNGTGEEIQATGFVGHAVLSNHRVLFDYSGRQFALRRSRGPRRVVLGQQRLLDQDMAAYGDAPSRGLYRARLLIGLDRLDQGRALLDGFVQTHLDPNDDEARTQVQEARIYLAQLLRLSGQFSEARDVLAPFTPADLVDWREIGNAVNGLVLDDLGDQALDLANQGVQERPDSPHASIALADARMATGDLLGASEALRTAIVLQSNPSGQLLRRARVALLSGDHFGALSHLRELVALYPGEGKYLWFYALIMTEGDAETFRSDMTKAVGRLHPHDHPIDYLVAAHAALGETDRAMELMNDGVDKDCRPLASQALVDNCVAWYFTLAGHELDEALDRVTSAIESGGPRSDFLDTKAMVHLARREFEEARESATTAARMNPNDPYLLWQVERVAVQATHPFTETQ